MNAQNSPLIVFEKVTEALKGKEPVFFFDFDGTLTPIVSKPEQAVLAPAMKHTMEQIANRFHTAILTGRDRQNVIDLVGIGNMIYAGSHGYEISGPGDIAMVHSAGKEIIPLLDRVELELMPLLQSQTQGVYLDRKKFALGLHYRNAQPQDEQTVYRLASEMIVKYPPLKLGEGKKILEIKPAHSWHKGKALLWILEKLCVGNSDEYVPMFFGDDITDEDAFEVIANLGVGIIVGDHGQATKAHYRLTDVQDVEELLNLLLHKYK